MNVGPARSDVVERADVGANEMDQAPYQCPGEKKAGRGDEEPLAPRVLEMPVVQGSGRYRVQTGMPQSAYQRSSVGSTGSSP